MNLEFEKIFLPYLRCVVSEVKDQEQTGEIRLPDGAPDVGRVLCNWGQVFLRGKEWRGNGMSASGGVSVKVLYEPDGDDDLQCVETWIPFQMKWDFPQTEKDGYIRISPRLLGVDARMASARKLIVCVRLGIFGKAMVSDHLQMPMLQELPEDVYVLKNTYPLQLPVEAGEKAFTLEEGVSLSDAKTIPDKMINYSITPAVNETKLMSDKLVFRGTANLHVVYIGADGRLHSFDQGLPFSQYTQLDNEYDDAAQVSMDMAVTNLELERGDGDTYTCKFGVSAQYTIFNNRNAELIEDVYSPIRKMQCTTEDIHIPAVLDRREVIMEAQSSLSTEMEAVYDAVFYPGIPGSYIEEGEAFGDLSGKFQVIGEDVSAKPCCADGRWETSFPLNVNVDTRTEMNILQDPIVDVRQEGDLTVASTKIPLGIVTLNRKPISVITGVDVGEPVKQDPEIPSTIIRRVGEDSLWKIAKEAGSSVEAIRLANCLEGELHPEQLVLIPLS